MVYFSTLMLRFGRTFLDIYYASTNGMKCITVAKRTVFVFLFAMLLTSIGSATTINVSTVAQLVNAVNTGAADTINIAPGTYLLTSSLTPKANMTIKGAGISSTILKPASSWNPGTAGLPYPPTSTSVNATAYMFSLGSNDRITIYNMTMDGMKQLQGAVYGNGSNYLTIYNIYFHDYTFNGVRVIAATNLAIHDCEFINMAIAGMDPEAGAVVFAWLSNSELYNNQFYFATHGILYGSGVNAGNFFGYKGRQLRQSRIHHNTIMINFSIELPFEFDQDVEIDHNYITGMISVPRTGDGGGTPPSGVAFHIHHNYVSSGQVLENPRICVELDHNLIDNNRFEGASIISGWYDNALYPGPMKVHNNLINNLGRGICDIGRYNNFQFYNNHVKSTNNPGANSSCFIIATGATEIDRSKFVVKDNIFDFSAYARALFWAGLGAGFTSIQNNTLTNVTDQANYSNSNTGATRGLLAPLYFCCGAPGNPFLVNQWTITPGCGTTQILNEIRSPGIIELFPNPAGQSTVIRYNLAESGFVKISICDGLGKEIMQVVNEKQNVGEHTLNINTASLQNGIYFVKMNINSYHEAQKLFIK